MTRRAGQLLTVMGRCCQ